MDIDFSTISLAVSFVFSIRATAAADGTTNQTATATVYALPVAASLTATAATLTTGASTTLTPAFSNGTSASITYSGAAAGTLTTSPSTVTKPCSI